MFGASDGHADLQEGQFHAKGAIPNDTGFVAFIGSRRVTERTSILQSLKSMFSMPLLRTSDMSLLVGEAFLFPNLSAESLGLVALVSRKRCLALPLEGSWTRH